MALIADDEDSISGSSANSLPQQVLVEGVESGFIVMRLMLKLFIANNLLSLVVSHDDTYLWLYGLGFQYCSYSKWST